MLADVDLSRIGALLGAAVAARLFELGWVNRRPGGRALTLSPEGSRELRARFGLG